MMVRLKGFEPPTFWFVDTHGLYWNILYLAAKPCVATLCAALRVISFWNAFHFFAGLVTVLVTLFCLDLLVFCSNTVLR